MKHIFILIFILQSIFSYSQVKQEEAFLIELSDAQSKITGAAKSIQYRFAKEFLNSNFGKKIKFNKVTVTKFSGANPYSINLKGNSIGEVNIEFLFYDINRVILDNGIKTTVRADRSGNKSISIPNEVSLVHMTKKIDDITYYFYLLVPNMSMLEKLRVGQTVSIEYVYNAFRYNRIDGVLTKIYENIEMLKCSNAHEFDLNTGYKFCPKCGLPLENQ
jgi:hypothetical protein